MHNKKLQEIIRLMRYYILVSTGASGSGHPSSSLSAAELMGTLFFGGHFRADLNHPEHPNNDRLVFSKGHASPLLYALYAVAGKISEKELKTLRKFGSRLEGHPTMAFSYTEAATGSLGQGLSIGVGMALNAKMDNLSYTTYVLLGDSEMAEGSVWEAMELAAHYKLDNLVGILDVNRLGQRGETMHGHRVNEYKKKAQAFGWHAIVINGHDVKACDAALRAVAKTKGKPVMIIAKTIKGKGVPFMENKDGWHGKAATGEDLEKALKAIGPVKKMAGMVRAPKAPRTSARTKEKIVHAPATPVYKKGDMTATRKAYGYALVKLGAQYPDMVALDGETSNSTFAEFFKKEYPKRFFEMFIAEQNMVGTALGLSRRGKKPFCSTFAAFFMRAADQIRMCQYSDADMVFVGSHAGVSIGEDGSSQMGLEDLALFRSVLGSTVLYPSDAVSAEKLVEAAAAHKGITYIRTTRAETPVLYSSKESFPIGGSKTLKKSPKDTVTIFAAGITLHEALKANELLQKEGIAVRVVDMYSIKPLDAAVIKKACAETQALLVAEDHHAEGGLYEAICGSGEVTRPAYSLAVTKPPKSGTPQELLAYEGIDAAAMVKLVQKIIGK